MDIFKTIAPYLRARFGNTERGAALVEYALLLALIAVVCIVALTTLGGKASSKFNDHRQLSELVARHHLTSPRVTERGAGLGPAPFAFPGSCSGPAWPDERVESECAH